MRDSHNRDKDGNRKKPGLSWEERSLYAIDKRFVFFAVFLLAAFTGLQSALAFAREDLSVATVLAFLGLLIFVGLIAHFFVGLPLWLRYYHWALAAVFYFFVLFTGNADPLSLLGAIVVIPGLVALPGWRRGAILIALVNLVTALGFWLDLYGGKERILPPLVEIKFLACALGLSLFSLAFSYSVRSALELLSTSSRQLRKLSYRDTLTELPSRLTMTEQLRFRTEEYKRLGNLFALILIRIDNLKVLDESYGNEFADGVTLRVANVLVQGLRGQDVIGRWSWDQFLVMLPGQTEQGARTVSERLRRRLAEIELIMMGEPVAIPVSMGIAASESASTTDHLMAAVTLDLNRGR